MDDIDKTIAPQRFGDGRKEGRFMPGDAILGRYKVVAELGQGGMGVVYKCFDEIAGIEVALKALPPELSHNSLEMEDIRHNFQLVEKLHHPNIAAYKNLERDSKTGDYYLIMECVEGQELSRWFRTRRREGDLKPEEVLPIIRQVAAALDYAHERQIIHRDIKPGNIMIAADGTIKVLDFGLAAQIHTSMTRVSMAYHGTSGTGPYMAPEQWDGQLQDAAADQYALAVLAYELLAGHPPFESHDIAILREAVLKGTPRRIDQIPAGTWNALRRALDKDRKMRFKSCMAFADALGGAKIRGGTVAVPWKKSGWIGLAVIALAAAGTVGYRAYQQKAEAGQIARHQAEQQENLAAMKQFFQAGQYDQAFACARKADPNSSEVQLHLALMYGDGKGAPQNRSEALSLLRRSADQGNAQAQWHLGQLYETGKGVDNDEAEALKWYRQAAEQGDAGAQDSIGALNLNHCLANMKQLMLAQMMYAGDYNGCFASTVKPLADYAGDRKVFHCLEAPDGRDCDYLVVSVSIFKESDPDLSEMPIIVERLGNHKEKLVVGYGDGHVGTFDYDGKNYTGLLKFFARLPDAKKELLKRQFELWDKGVFDFDPVAETARVLKEFHQFYDAEKYDEAFACLENADQSHPEVQSNLGTMYYHGRGVAKNETEAFKWYRKAAEQGYASAQKILVKIHQLGGGVANDEAVKWYRKAAEQGNADAQYGLGDWYANGLHVGKDEAEAVKWYRKAAEQGHAGAQNDLGEMYYYARGVSKDYAEAVKWYRKAAEQGNAEAQFSLGFMYANGQGVSRDLTIARSYYNTAAKQGYQLAIDRLAELDAAAAAPRWLFPLCGAELGKTTVAELAKLGKKDSIDDYCYKISGFDFWYFDGSVFDGMYLRYDGPWPEEWLKLGYDMKKSYNDWLALLKRDGYAIIIKEKPHVETYSGHPSFYAEVKGYRETPVQHYIELEFKYSKQTTADAAGSLYSFRISLEK